MATCTTDAYLTPTLERDLTNRLSRIEGHVASIKRMLAEHQSCDDIVTQLAAVRAAINQVAVKLLEGHITTCVADAARHGKGEEAFGELITALRRLLKHS